MSYANRTFTSHLHRPSSISNAAAAVHAQASSSQTQSPALQARINEKKLELENLRQLRELSAALATQMQTLQEKLATLTDGTEGRSYLEFRRQAGQQYMCHTA